jgi:hypothetical protein
MEEAAVVTVVVTAVVTVVVTIITDTNLTLVVIVVIVVVVVVATDTLEMDTTAEIKDTIVEIMDTVTMEIKSNHQTSMYPIASFVKCATMILWIAGD